MMRQEWVDLKSKNYSSEAQSSYKTMKRSHKMEVNGSKIKLSEADLQQVKAFRKQSKTLSKEIQRLSALKQKEMRFKLLSKNYSTELEAYTDKVRGFGKAWGAFRPMVASDAKFGSYVKYGAKGIWNGSMLQYKIGTDIARGPVGQGYLAHSVIKPEYDAPFISVLLNAIPDLRQ